MDNQENKIQQMLCGIPIDDEMTLGEFMELLSKKIKEEQLKQGT